MYKDYYLTVPTWSFHQCSRCLSSSLCGVIISSHFSDVFLFFPKRILKTLESFREWWWRYHTGCPTFHLKGKNIFGPKIKITFFFWKWDILVIFKTPCSKAKGQGINAFLKSHKSILALFFAKETFFVEKGKSTSHSSYLLTVKRINSC